jgi:ketosteroid isomerase-like protein
MDSFDQTLERYHAGLGDFVNGDPRPVLQLFSQREDVVLCNPLRPFARGPKEVAETSEQAASHFAGGVHEVELVTAFATADLGYSVHIERFRATIDGSDGSGVLRVTTIFRLEGDGWRISHRHADPISTPQAMTSVLQK